MLRKAYGIFLIILLLFSPIVVKSDNITDTASTLESSTISSEYYPQLRSSNYTVENRTISPYPEILMSDQQISSSNASFIEKILEFNLTSTTMEVTFNLTSDDIFLAIDGASQSFVLRVNYTIYFPNGTLASRPITTTATSPMHFYVLNPPAGVWRVIATLLDTGETTAWIQAVSYNNGAKYITEIEKEQIHLIAGQNLYFKIPLLSEDWFYLYVNRYTGADVTIDLRKQGAYNVAYKSYTNYASELFTSKSHSLGTYLLKIINKGSTDIFVEIVKKRGVKFELSVDNGKTIKSRFQVDMDFFKLTITEYYDWIAFDGAVVQNGMTARYLIIDPDLNILLDSTSSTPSSFKEKMISYPKIGSYFIAIFGTGYAIATIKITGANSIDSIDFVRLDQNWTFTQSGQTFYLKIMQSQKYFFFVGMTCSAQQVKYAILNPSLVSLWSVGPSTGLAFYPPTKPTVSFYILKITGQTNSSSLIHARFQGLEDYWINTPDCSVYWPRFIGDLIVANLSVRNSNYVIQHSYGTPDVYVALFDTSYNQKVGRTFTSQTTYFDRWRKGYENPPSGIWLQIVIGIADHFLAVELSTIQSGDESGIIVTPFQYLALSSWNNVGDCWEVRTYSVDIGSPKWFGIVCQLLSVNTTIPLKHPELSLWVYDSTLTELTSITVNYNNRFRTSFWADPKPGIWLVVVAKYYSSSPQQDPLNCSISYISDLDFHRDWPSNLVGNITSFQITIENRTSVIAIQSNSTISNFEFRELSNEISFNVSGPEGTRGFCVVTIPKELANRPFSVLIDGKQQNGLLSHENSTHTSIYFSYDHEGSQRVIVTPEFQQFTIPLLFLIATLLAIIIYKKKRTSIR
jgi:hypothetical protein